MDGRFTEPRDLRPQADADPPLRRDRVTQESNSVGQPNPAGHREMSHENSATKSSRVFFFVMAAIIALAIAVFLILHPQAGD
jgi:hypothetical protein